MVPDGSKFQGHGSFFFRSFFYHDRSLKKSFVFAPFPIFKTLTMKAHSAVIYIEHWKWGWELGPAPLHACTTRDPLAPKVTNLFPSYRPKLLSSYCCSAARPTRSTSSKCRRLRTGWSTRTSRTPTRSPAAIHPPGPQIERTLQIEAAL